MRKFYSLLIISLLISAIGTFQAPTPVGAGTGSLSFTPSYVYFTSQTVGTKSTPVDVTIKNTGSANVTLGRLTATGEFILRVGECTNGKVIAPTQTCIFKVIFAPLSIAYKSGVVTIPSDAANPLYTISLSGYGAGTNLLVSPNFEFPLIKPIPWEVSPYVAGLTYFLDCSVWVSPICSVRLRGSSYNSTHAQSIYQARGLVGTTGDKYAFLLSSKARDIPTGGVYLVEVVLMNAYNQVVGSKTINLNTGTHDWQTVAGTIRATTQYAWVVFRFTLGEAGGTAWFDNAILVKIP
jgi:hypothetical protein